MKVVVLYFYFMIERVAVSSFSLPQPSRITVLPRIPSVASLKLNTAVPTKGALFLRALRETGHIKISGQKFLPKSGGFLRGHMFQELFLVFLLCRQGRQEVIYIF